MIGFLSYVEKFNNNRLPKQTISLQNFSRLCSTSFTWFILEYLVSLIFRLIGIISDLVLLWPSTNFAIAFKKTKFFLSWLFPKGYITCRLSSWKLHSTAFIMYVMKVKEYLLLFHELERSKTSVSDLSLTPVLCLLLFRKSGDFFKKNRKNR